MTSSANAATATLAAIRRAAPQPELHGALLVYRADLTHELFPEGGGAAAGASSSSSLAPVRSLLSCAFDRRFRAHPADLPDLVASAYTPDALFSNNLATVASPANIAAAWRFLAAPFAFVGTAGSPLRVEAIAWAPAAWAPAAEVAGAEEGLAAAGMFFGKGAAAPPAGPQAGLSPVVEEEAAAGHEEEEEEEEEAQEGLGAFLAQGFKAPPSAPLLPSTASVALVVETEQRWRLFPTLVLVRAVFGDSLRVRVTSTLRLSSPGGGGGGKISSHADRVEGWWSVPRPLRALLGVLAPAVVTALGW